MMMDKNASQPSPAQERQRNLTDPTASVWVEASAGSGKTKALTDRVLSLLVQGVSSQAIVCLTFTKAAAAEMRQRVMERLRLWTILDTPDLKEDIAQLLGCTTQTVPDKILQSAKALLDTILDSGGGLAIETLHALCARLLQRFPVEAGLPPFMTVLDPEDCGALWQKALDQVVKKSYDDQTLQQALTEMSERYRPEALCDLIQAIARDPMVIHCDSARERRDQVRQVVADLMNVPAECDPLAALEQFCEASLPDDLVKWANEDPEPSARIVKTWAELRGDKRSLHWSQYRGVFLTKTNTIRKSLLKSTKKNIDLARILHTEAERVQATEEMMQRAKCARQSWACNHVYHAMAASYAAQKAFQGVMDPDDLIARAHYLLKQADAAAWVVFKLDAQIAHVLVDEAQDTSLQQWALVQALTEDFFAGEGASERNRTVFVVGDRKQSIYGFQGASVTAFQALKRYFSARAERFHIVDLLTSYRTVPEVLACVDAVAAQKEIQRAWQGYLQDPNELADVRHESHRHHHHGSVQVWPLLTDDADINDDEGDLDDALSSASDRAHPRVAMAHGLAQWIAALVQNPPWIAARQRLLKPQDIMILVRQRSPFVDALRQALIRKKVAVVDADRFAISEAIPCRDLLALCEWILLPEDAMNLAIVLKSPLFSLSEEDLFQLAHDRGGGSLWQRVQVSRPDVGQKLLEWQRKALSLPPLAWFQEFLATNGRKEWVTALGPGCHESLDQWLTIVQRYQAFHTPTLQGFMAWFHDQDAMVAQRESHADEAQAGVRIMTVHGAKGLQAPVVILADTVQPSSQERDFHIMPEQGVIVCGDGMRTLSCLIPSRERDQAAQAAEHQRLLYVAMTRAEDHLIVMGWKNRQRLPEGTWYQNVVNGLLKCSPSPVDLPDALNFLTKRGYTWTKPDFFNHHWGMAVGQPLAPALMPDDAPEIPVNTADSHENTLTKMLEEPGWLFAAVTPISETSQQVQAVTAWRGEPRSSVTPIMHDYSFFTSPSVRQRGTHIHRLLEILPQLPPARWSTVAVQLLGQETAQAILPVVEAVLTNPQWAWIFGGNSQAEVPLAGEYCGQAVVGTIDRLVRFDDRWCIIDFKTGDATEQPPDAYRQQLAIYASLLVPKAPSVEAYILWVDAGQLVSVPLT